MKYVTYESVATIRMLEYLDQEKVKEDPRSPHDMTQSRISIFLYYWKSLLLLMSRTMSVVF